MFISTTSLAARNAAMSYCAPPMRIGVGSPSVSWPGNSTELRTPPKPLRVMFWTSLPARSTIAIWLALCSCSLPAVAAEVEDRALQVGAEGGGGERGADVVDDGVAVAVGGEAEQLLVDVFFLGAGGDGEGEHGGPVAAGDGPREVAAVVAGGDADDPQLVAVRQREEQLVAAAVGPHEAVPGGDRRENLQTFGVGVGVLAGAGEQQPRGEEAEVLAGHVSPSRSR
jgi:hypothetical protein